MRRDVGALHQLARIAVDGAAAKETLAWAASIIRLTTGATQAMLVYAEDQDLLVCSDPGTGAAADFTQIGLWIVQRQIIELGRPVAFNLIGHRVEGFTSAFSDDDREFLALAVPTSQSPSEMCILRGPWQPKERASILRFMESAMPALTIILERFLNADRSRRQGEQLHVLANAAQVLTRSENVEAALIDLATAIAASTGFEYIVNIDMYDAATGRFFLRILSEQRHTTGTLGQIWRASLDPDRPDPWNMEVMTTLQPSFRPDMQNDPVYPEHVRMFFTRSLLRSAAVFPMLFQDEFLGTMSFVSFKPRAFPAEESSFLQGFATQAAMALKALQMHKELQQYTHRVEASMQIEYRQARTDALTGIPNRRYADEAIAVECRRAHSANIPLSVAMADIDGLKFVNDTYGHPAGDTVLASVASLARRSCRRMDAVARYGGDEFLFILPTADLQAATAIAHRFLNRVARWRFHPSTEHTLRIGVSVGVAEADEDCAKQPALLVARADEALLRAKSLGKDRVCPYLPAKLVPQPSVEVAP